MKEEINLLPQSAGRARVQRLYLTRIGLLLHRALLALALLILVEGGIYAVLYFTEEMALAGATVAQSDDAEEIKKVQAVNGMLARAHEQSTVYKPWTPLAEEIISLLPADMKITSLQLDERTGALAVAGTFSSRSSVRELQTRLEKLSWVSKVDAPLSNFATGNQQGFSFTISRQATATPKPEPEPESTP